MSGKPTPTELLSHCLERGYTFVAFRHPHATLRVWVQREADCRPQALGNISHKCFLLAPFQPDAPIHAVQPDEEWEFGPGALVLSLPRLPNGPSSTIGQQLPEPTERNTFERSVREAQTLMEEGPLEKVVLSRALLAGLPEGAVAHLFMEALTVHPETLVALAHTPATGTWLGASPERLISFENELVRTEAVAGTRSVDQGPVELEAWGEKERHEQAVVAQAVEQALMASGARSIHQHPAEVITQGRLAHLRTRFTAELSTVDRARLVAHLHPTPAVCGSPREKALAFIASHEAHPRGLYAGYWGVWDPAGRTELFVNIRCLQAHGEKAVVYAGAGITAGSDPGMEWLETSRKAAIWSGPLNKLMPSPTSSHT